MDPCGLAGGGGNESNGKTWEAGEFAEKTASKTPRG